MPSSCQISSRSAKRCTRKGLQFLTLQYFGAPGDSLGQSSSILALLYSKAAHKSAKFRPVLTIPLRYMCCKVRRFRWQRDRQKHHAATISYKFLTAIFEIHEDVYCSLLIPPLIHRVQTINWINWQININAKWQPYAHLPARIIKIFSGNSHSSTCCLDDFAIFVRCNAWICMTA